VAAANAGSPGGEPRVSTGNVGLDAMLDGGLVARRPYLIVGPSGTGKTTLALQFLCAGIRNGERALLVTLEEPPNEVRANHRGLAPELGRVDVFDAIPDVMRYERAPFKDIAAVRSATPFERVAEEIRHTPELTSIEVTITALEQMLRTEVQRHAYSRIVIDSLTALQYFCMKGFDIVAGAQTFLRYLSDLRVTTILTVEAPLEDVETPERMLARGEIRLFRWELDDMTVRAVGVEKFRGSSHDLRLHPYRIGPTGLDINLGVTISRDTRQIVNAVAPLVSGDVAPGPAEPVPSTLDILVEELNDLVLVGADTDAIRSELEASLAAARAGDSDHATQRLLRAVALGSTLPDQLSATSTHPEGDIARALHRLVARAESSRVGEPPVRVPEPPILTARLAKILLDLKPPKESTPPPAAPVAAPAPAPPPILAEAGAAPVIEPAPTPAPIAPPARVSPPTDVAPTSGTEPRALPPIPHPVRSTPPPWPQAVRLPEGIAPSPPAMPPTPTPIRPRAPSKSAAPPVVAGPSVVGPTDATASPTGPAPPGPGDSTAAATSPEVPRPKKRKRSPSGARKKSTPSESTGPSVPGDGTSAPEGPTAPEPMSPETVPTGTATEGPASPAPSGGTTAAPRPKRRVVRKKKAPSVVGATAGPPPDDGPPDPDPTPGPAAPDPETPARVP
jgi:KaiC/GvpD/RAD55 family RecA-like ATPase